MFRYFILPLVAFLLTLFQSAVVSELLPDFVKPDLILILITYLGASPLLITGAILVFFCGLLQETFSGSPHGLFLFIYLSIFFFFNLSLPGLGWILPQGLMTCAVGWPLFHLFKRLETLPGVEPSPLEP
jgi:hypothetical protein